MSFNAIETEKQRAAFIIKRLVIRNKRHNVVPTQAQALNPKCDKCGAKDGIRRLQIHWHRQTILHHHRELEMKRHAKTVLLLKTRKVAGKDN